MDVRFENLASLHLLWLVVGLFGVVWYGMARRRAALERFASRSLLTSLMPGGTLRRRWVKSLVVIAAMLLLVLAATDPRWGLYYENLPRRGMDVIFVVDVSRSMLARDLRPNRLERAKQYIRDMLDTMAGDRVGLIAFAGAPSLKCPLTINYSAFRMSLDEVTVKASPRGGTLLGDAIRTACDSFVDKIKDHKAIVVITDGEDQESYPVEAAKQAYSEMGIRVYTVGLGDDNEGARVPAKDSHAGVYMQYQGQEVWSKMNPQTLKEVALAGGGAYVPVGTKDIDLGQVLYEERIAQMARREFETSRVERHQVQFQWFAGAALLLLFVEMAIAEVKAGK